MPICGGGVARPPSSRKLDETAGYLTALWRGRRLEALTRLWLAGVDVTRGDGRGAHGARPPLALPGTAMLRRPVGTGLPAERRRRPMTLTTGERPQSLAAEPYAEAAAPVKVWLCLNDDLTPDLASALATHWLDEEEQETAGRFLFERDRRQYLVAHTLVRRALALEAGLRREPRAEAARRRGGSGRRGR